jgi:hypothetical protein
MQQYRTFWLLLTMMLVGGFTLTSCVENKDDASGAVTGTEAYGAYPSTCPND